MTSRNIKKRAARTQPRPWPTDVMPARFNSICPVCSRGIVAGRSKIAPLAVPLVPAAEHVHYVRGTFMSVYRCRPMSVQPRDWAHADCIRRVPEDREELQMLADERVEALRDMKRLGDGS